MGSEEGEECEKPVHKVKVNSFFMNQYPITNEEFCKFLNEVGNQKEEGVYWYNIESKYSAIEEVWGKYVVIPGYEDHPVVNVNWYGAVAYAKWKNLRLPTEAEWEYAARGGLEQKRYPFGDEISHDLANYWGKEGRDIWDMTSPVGYFPPNGYGLYDMAGNVWEWCLDWYDENYYKISPYENPKGPEKGKFKVLRGGSWHYLPFYLRCAYRDCADPKIHVNDVGFRCVKDVKK